MTSELQPLLFTFRGLSDEEESEGGGDVGTESDGVEKEEDEGVSGEGVDDL